MAIHVDTNIIPENNQSRGVFADTTTIIKVFAGTTKVWEKLQSVTLYSNYSSGIYSFSISNIFDTYSKVTIFSSDTDGTSGVGIDSWVFTDYGDQIQLADGMSVSISGINTWSGEIYEIIAEV